MPKRARAHLYGNPHSLSVRLIETGIFATKPVALHPSMLVVNGVSVTSFSTRCTVKTEHPSKGSICGLARGWIIYRDELKTFEALPFSIEDCFGLFARWAEPKHDEPISTSQSLHDWSTAQATFNVWTRRAIEDHWATFTPSPLPRRRRRFFSLQPSSAPLCQCSPQRVPQRQG